jgi:signal transduction histidine kinase
VVEAQERTRALAIVSHDLRNELSTIHMAAQLMRDTPLDESTRREHLRRIESKAESLSRLVHDLLDVARMQEGQFPLRLEPVDVMELMEEIVWSLEPLAQQRGITLRAVGAGPVAATRMDRERIRQALSNLMQNAMKFTAPGGTVQVDAARVDGDIRFAVRDDGCGITSEDIEHVFDPYWQKAGTAAQGTGLGLSIVRGIVEAHNGRVWVESTPDAGSAFCFTLPAESAAKSAVAIVPSLLPARNGSRLRKLVDELRRRHVFQVIVIYVTSCFALIQGAQVVLPVLGMPTGIVDGLVLGSLSGLPITTLLAWLFEVKRDRGSSRQAAVVQE